MNCGILGLVTYIEQTLPLQLRKLWASIPHIPNLEGQWERWICLGCHRKSHFWEVLPVIFGVGTKHCVVAGQLLLWPWWCGLEVLSCLAVAYYVQLARGTAILRETRTTFWKLGSLREMMLGSRLSWRDLLGELNFQILQESNFPKQLSLEILIFEVGVCAAMFMRWDLHGSDSVALRLDWLSYLDRGSAANFAAYAPRYRVMYMHYAGAVVSPLSWLHSFFNKPGRNFAHVVQHLKPFQVELYEILDHIWSTGLLPDVAEWGENQYTVRNFRLGQISFSRSTVSLVERSYP